MLPQAAYVFPGFKAGTWGDRQRQGRVFCCATKPDIWLTQEAVKNITLHMRGSLVGTLQLTPPKRACPTPAPAHLHLAERSDPVRVARAPSGALSCFCSLLLVYRSSSCTRAHPSARAEVQLHAEPEARLAETAVTAGSHAGTVPGQSQEPKPTSLCPSATPPR